MANIIVPFYVNLIITDKHGVPAIELRSLTTDSKIIKELVEAAFHNKDIILKPRFNNMIHSTNSLIEKGILYRNPEDGKLYFSY